MDALAKIKSEMLPFAELMGIEIHRMPRPTGSSPRLPVREALCTRPAVLHGGAIMAFADTLGATGTILNLPEGAGTTTIESKTNFIAAAPLGTRVTGEATPLHRGRRTMVVADPDHHRRGAGSSRWSRRPSWCCEIGRCASAGAAALGMLRRAGAMVAGSAPSPPRSSAARRR